MAISLPLTVLLKLGQVSADGQQESPGKQRQFELDSLAELAACADVTSKPVMINKDNTSILQERNARGVKTRFYLDSIKALFGWVKLARLFFIMYNCKLIIRAKHQAD